MSTVDWDSIADIPMYGRQKGPMTLAELDRFPVLRKEDIARDFPHHWMTPHLRQAMEAKQVEFATSSGTTSDRLQILRPKDWWLDEYRRTYRHMDGLKAFRVGEDAKAILTTAVCSNTTCFLDHPSMEERIRHHTLYLNSTPDPNRWNRDDITRMVDELAQFAPLYLDVDPVYFALFLSKAQEFGIALDFPRPRALTLSYELTPQVCRSFIERHFSTQARNLYGTTETGYLYAEDATGTLQRCPELSYVELLPFAPDQGLYQLLVTSFKNTFMPLLRYDVGDLVKVDLSAEKIQAQSKGDSTPIAYFCGRVRDAIEVAPGRFVTPGEFDRALASRKPDLLLYQATVHDHALLFQYIRPGGEPLRGEDEAALSDVINQLFGPSTTITFARAAAIRPEHSGKFRTLKKE
jgi:phenylacetate-CoA ligase